MNVSLHFKKTLKILIPPLIWLVGLVQLHAQSITFHSFQKITQDTIDILEFDSYAVAYYPQIEQQATNGTAVLYKNGVPGNFGNRGWPGENTLDYVPNPGFYGYDYFSVRYWEQGLGYSSVPVIISVEILVLPSFVIAENDYATTTVGQTVEIDVLANDFGNGTNLTISSLPHTTYGTASVNGDPYVLIFTPEAGFSGVAHLNYTVCDDQGSCDMATVSVCVVDNAPPATDSLFITTAKNEAQVVLMDLSGFSVSQAPSNGQLDSLDALEYVPNTDFVGYDQVIFSNGSGSTKVLDVHVLDKAAPNVFVKDDLAHTIIGQEVEIDVLANDLAGNSLYGVWYTQLPSHGQLTNVSQGVWNYIPDAGFEGVDQFVYKASSTQGPGNNEYGTVYIVVSDQNPSLPVFELTTPKNTPLVIDYKIPVDDYVFSNINQGNLGNAVFHSGQQTVTSTYGQQFSGYNMLVYTPSQDLTGTDEFEFEYCVGGNSSNCPEVKVVVEIIDIPGGPSGPFCAGGECVWTGDSNHDGKVDVRDLLPIGLCMGEVGTARPNAALEWYGQYSNDWNSYLAQMGFDVKHIDTDGDGYVTSVDTTAIGEFYGNYNNLTSQSVNSFSNLPFFIEEPDLTGIEPGDIITTNIWLGTSSVPAYDAYGLTFQLLYDPLLFEAVNVNFDEFSWMSYDSPILTMVKKPESGKVDAGYTRTSGVSGNGYGVIGTVEFIVVDDIIGFRPEGANGPTSIETSISFQPMGLMNGSGNMFNQNGNDINITIKLPGERSDEEELENDAQIISDKLNVYPNPANDQINVHLNGYENQIERIALYTVTGHEVYNSGKVAVKRAQIDASNLEEGMYVMKVWSNGGFMNQKVEIIR